MVLLYTKRSIAKQQINYQPNIWYYYIYKFETIPILSIFYILLKHRLTLQLTT
jgi:hypothetical protein